MSGQRRWSSDKFGNGDMMEVTDEFGKTTMLSIEAQM